MTRPCIPKATPRDRRSYHYPPQPAECPRCESYPFDAGDGCAHCGLGRAYALPAKLDPDCGFARGWASGWPNTRPPSADQVAKFVHTHRLRCDRCQRYSIAPRRLRRSIRQRLRDWARSSSPHTHDSEEAP